MNIRLPIFFLYPQSIYLAIEGLGLFDLHSLLVKNNKLTNWPKEEKCQGQTQFNKCDRRWRRKKDLWHFHLVGAVCVVDLYLHDIAGEVEHADADRNERHTEKVKLIQDLLLHGRRDTRSNNTVFMPHCHHKIRSDYFAPKITVLTLLTLFVVIMTRK